MSFSDKNGLVCRFVTCSFLPQKLPFCKVIHVTNHDPLVAESCCSDGKHCRLDGLQQPSQFRAKPQEASHLQTQRFAKAPSP